MCSLARTFVKQLSMFTRHAYKSDIDNEIDIALKYVIFMLQHLKLVFHRMAKKINFKNLLSYSLFLSVNEPFTDNNGFT